MTRADVYYGSTAAAYERKRAHKRLWKVEDRTFRSMLEATRASQGATVLDIPVGTGRFLPHYRELGFKVVGYDLSEDMLAEARSRSYEGVELGVGNVTNIPLSDGQVDVAVCVRLLYLVDRPTMKRAIAEVSRTSSQQVILSLRLYGWDRSHRWSERVRRRAACIRAVWKFRRGKDTTRPYRRTEVLAQFRRADLVVRDSSVIHKMSDGSDYCMLRLEHRQHAK